MRSQAARLLADEVAWISADQMREVDRIMIRGRRHRADPDDGKTRDATWPASFSISTTPLPRPYCAARAATAGAGWSQRDILRTPAWA